MINLLNAAHNDGDFRDPDVSPAGPTTAEALPEETVRRNRELVGKHAAALYDASAEEILAWTRRHAPGPIVITMSMENTVLAELAAAVGLAADLLFLDTEYHFPETLDVADAVAQRYPQFPLIRAHATYSRKQQDEVYGPNLYLRNPTACCRMRKVEPLQRHLSGYAVIVDGLRRADGPTRTTSPAISVNPTGRLKVSPMITWSLEDTESFIRSHDLIVHPLTRQGYPSIGCATCTSPVAPGADPRSGRWSFAAKTECGLHTDQGA